MIWPGHLMFTLKAGESFRHVPAHLDILMGAGRLAGRLDGGAVDNVLNRYGGGARVATVYHARASLGRPGEQHQKFDEIEESLGLSRTYRVQIADHRKSMDTVRALRELALVESAGVQLLAVVPESLDANVSALDFRQAWLPHSHIRAREALQLEAGDERITVCVADSGIMVGHPEFQRRCLAGYDTVDLGMGQLNDNLHLVGDSRGYDYNPIDEVGHGCHVAGIIGAQGWHIPPGVAGKARLLPIRVLAAAVSGGNARRLGVGSIADIDAGLKVAVDLGACVINMSFGTPVENLPADTPSPHSQVVAYAVQHGVTLVAAAGNTGVEATFFPAAHPDVICVGSIDLNTYKRSKFSTFGSHVTLCAPGEGIISTTRYGYGVNSGTSFAAPFVSGVVALMLSRALRAGRQLRPRDVKNLLVKSVQPLDHQGFSPETGYGFLDAVEAIRQTDGFLRSLS